MDPLTLSRFQFAGTAEFHILFPIMSVGLSLYMLVMEILWLRTGKLEYYHQLRFWLKIFLLTFAIGVASGLPMSLQFGTNWAAFSTAAGSFFGNLLGFETTIAFTLETAFLGIFVFGWSRVSRSVHLLANFFVLLGASLSAFWIVAANSWMQIPMGIHVHAGKVIVDSYYLAIFNPDTLPSFFHMWVACVETTLFMMAGISALVLLAKRHTDEHTSFFLATFKYVLLIAIIVAPLQAVIGDSLGLIVSQYQPEKLAAMELHWDSNLPGTGASWSLVAWPNSSNNGNSFAIEVPDALSLLITHSTTGRITGLNDFAVADRPTAIEAVLTYYSFRVMILIGFFMIGLVAVGCWFWYKGKLTVETIVKHRTFLRFWAYSIPLGFIATEAGWMTREIGRQPWTLYHMLKTSESLSSGLNSTVISIAFMGIICMYVTILVLFVYFVGRIIKKGPDLNQKP